MKLFKIKNLALLLGLLSAGIVATGCSSDKDDPVYPTTFEISAERENLEIGLSSTTTIKFYATGEGAIDLKAEVSSPTGWECRVIDFSPVTGQDYGYEGTLSVKAPDSETSSMIATLTITRQADKMSKTKDIKLSSSSNPLTVALNIDKSPVAMGVGASVSIPFTVDRNKPITLTTNTVAGNSDWTVSVEGFEAGDADPASPYAGKLKIVAPDKDSYTDITLSILSGSDVMASARIEARCDDKGVQITLDDDELLFAPGGQVTTGFKVSGPAAVNITAKVEASQGWHALLTSFEEASDGYEGSVKITAPGANSTGTVIISILDADNKVIGTNEITVECNSSVMVTLERESMSFLKGETETITFVATGSEDLTAEVSASSGWKASVKSFDKADNGYDGVLEITAPDSDSEGTITLKVKNKDGDSVEKLITVTSGDFAIRMVTTNFDFKPGQERYISYDVFYSGSGTLAQSLETPAEWRELVNDEGKKLEPNEEGTGWSGRFMLHGGMTPQTNKMTITVREKESDKTVSETVTITVSGGNEQWIPKPKSAANCIIVGNTGTVTIDARKGDGTAVTGTKADWIWSDTEGIIKENSIAYSSGKITLQTSDSFKPGNIVIALLNDSNQIQWSWHLWFVTGVNESAMPGTFMNMNVGATSFDKNAEYEDMGLFYQWGRKDPIIGGNKKNGDVETGENAFSKETTLATYINPNFKYTWGVVDQKFSTHELAAQQPTKMIRSGNQLPSSGYEAWGPVSDPCPKGWRVPTYDEMRLHWGYYDSSLANPGKDSGYYGSWPATHTDEWWPGTGSRMSFSSETQDWDGALRLTGGGNYWTATPYGSTSDEEDPGYSNGTQVSWSHGWAITVSSWAKRHGCAVRCIKE